MIPVPTWALRLLATFLAAGALFGSGWWIGRDGVQDEAREKALVATAKAEQVRRATEDAWQLAHWQFAYAAEEKRAEREKVAAATEACLRDGTCRVRDKFSCPKVPRDPAAPAELAGEESGFRAEDALVPIGIADEADQIADERNQCIASYNALRASP